MKRIIILLMIIAVGLPCVAGAAKKNVQPAEKPVVVVFGMLTGDKTMSGNDIVASAALQQLSAVDKFQIVLFNPGLPVIARAIIEKRLPSDALTKTTDPKIAAKIAGIMNAPYALCVFCSITPPKAQGDKSMGDDVVVILDLTKLAGGNWVSKSGSRAQYSIGTKPEDIISMAASTAASGAVSGLVVQAFGEDAPFFTPAEPYAPVAEPVQVTVVTRNIDVEFAQSVSEADAALATHDTVTAIAALRKAINLKSDQMQPRIKLANAYFDLGMTSDAADECKRALLFNKDDIALHNMLAKLYIATGSLADAAAQCNEIVRLDPKNVDARLSLGDTHWNQGHMTEAESSYREAATIAPKNPKPHEKLRKLYVARKKYALALDEFVQYKVLSGASSNDAVAEVVQDEFDEVLGKLDSADSDYKHVKMVREDYYQECKDLGTRVDALDAFVSRQDIPDNFKSAYPHAVLAISLVQQANGYLISFLETEKSYYSEQADLLRNEAKTEFGLFSRGITGKV